MIISVNQSAYTLGVLRKAIVAAEKDIEPIKLVFLRDDRYQTIPLEYHGGLHYPLLHRVGGTQARFDDILAPSKRPPPAM